MIFNKNMWF